MRPMLLSLLAMGALTACSTGETGVVEGDSLLVRDCTSPGADRLFEPFVMHPDSYIVHEWGNEVYVRMQTSGRIAQQTNVFVLEILDIAAVQADVAAEPGAALSLDNIAIRAGLSLYESCPATRDPLQARGGTVRFNRFGIDDGGIMDVELSGFDLVNERTGEVAGRAFRAAAGIDIGVARVEVPFPKP